MALAEIREYEYLAADARGNVIAAGQEPARASQQVAIGTEADSAAFASGTRFILVTGDANLRWEVGADPTAGATSPRLAAGAMLFLGVVPGHKISIVTSAT